METKQEERLHARNLYFGTNMSQQEIADQCKINRKTLYLWINESGWRHAKYAAAHAPALLLDQYYEQLGKLNQHIASRENPWPTKDEATTIRKITMSINHFKESTGIKQTMNVFHDFLEYLRFKEGKVEMAKEFVQPIDRFVKKMIEDKKWLSYNYNTIANEEQHFEREHEEWLKTQKQDEQPDVIVPAPIFSGSSSNGQPATPTGTSEQPPADVIPTPTSGNHTSSPSERSGEVSQPKPENLISTPPKNKPATPNEPAQPTPQTFWELRQQQESARLGTNPPVKAQPYNPNSQSPIPNSAPRAITYSPGTQPQGTPVLHPILPRHLTNLDIQKMMETPQLGQQPNNFNPKRY